MNKIVDWSMTAAWNAAATKPNREAKPREYLWASELYRPMVDRYLSMKGVQPSNQPNDRSRRKFLCGDLFESFHGMVMTALGVQMIQQEEVWTRGVIPVKGRLDFLVSGIPDYEMAKKKLSAIGLPESITAFLLSVVDKFQELNGVIEFAPMIREAKSCSQFVMKKLMAGGKIQGHRLQLYHYLKGKELPLGYVDYLSREDLFMHEDKVVWPDEELEIMYNGQLENLKQYLDSEQQPPPDPLIVFENGKFSKNLGVEYSNYLTLVYGYERPDLYAEEVGPRITSWNRVLARLKKAEAGEKTPTGKPIEITTKNKESLKEMEKDGWKPYDLIKEAEIEEEIETI